MSGFAYTLSKKAVFDYNQLMKSGQCDFFIGADEDVEVGVCLTNYSEFLDTRDKWQRHNYFPVPPDAALDKHDVDYDYWYFNSQYYKLNQGSDDCCSDFPIAFHYVSLEEVLLLNYLFYNVSVFGVIK